ncbi:MAG: chemotaxis protein CheW [Bacteroidota bacterium]|nr:chemotaxis protein CheW [Odoribacter sp.]MDP3643978.1 chemotaxis protein CheW [Bacteroidota bacterium]
MATEIIQGLDSYFTFRIGNELFAVNIGHVTKILGMTDITKVPNSPRYFKGIINLFGDVLPVFDGRLKFGFPETENTRNTCILIFVFELDGQPVSSGIVVDSVEKVVIFEPEQIKPAPQIGKGFNSEFIHGIATLNDEFVIILNLEKIFSEEEISLINAVE